MSYTRTLLEREREQLKRRIKDAERERDDCLNQAERAGRRSDDALLALRDVEAMLASFVGTVEFK